MKTTTKQEDEYFTKLVYELGADKAYFLANYGIKYFTNKTFCCFQETKNREHELDNLIYKRISEANR